jgi:hypothetical protein
VVERNLAKVDVVGSNPITRLSKKPFEDILFKGLFYVLKISAKSVQPLTEFAEIRSIMRSLS